MFVSTQFMFYFNIFFVVKLNLLFRIYYLESGPVFSYRENYNTGLYKFRMLLISHFQIG